MPAPSSAERRRARPRSAPFRSRLHARVSLEQLEARTLLDGAPTIQLLDPTAISTTTGDKPQSKVWRREDTWWSVFPDNSGTYLRRLDGTAWTSVLKLTTSTAAKADTKVVGDVTHILLYRGTSTELASVEYVGGTYQLWSARPTRVTIPLSTGVEIATIDVDSTGRMWLASDGASTVEVRYSDAPYSNWSGPIFLESNISADDISVVTALPNGTVGVLWSNQNTDRFGFRFHVDGADPSAWSPDEVPASQSALPVGGGMADDHVHVAVATDGTLYAAVKTSYDTAGYTKIAMLVRRPTGTWDPLYSVDGQGTRPIVELNEATGRLLLFYSEAESGANIVYRESPLAPISFGPKQTLLTGSLNNASSTKQNFTDELVVIAAGGGTIRGARFTYPGVPVQPPVVYAGPDQTLVATTTATLDGAVSEGRPNPTGSPTIEWSKLSGPGTVTFGNANTADTSATFDQAGTYVLRLTAIDGGLTASDDITISVGDLSVSSLSFQDGIFPDSTYSGTRDTKLRSSSPTTIYGSSGTLELDGTPDEASLIRWDLQAIPAGSTVQSARITVNVTDASSDSYEIYEMKRDWLESAANWNQYAAGASWEFAGAQGASDRGSSVLGALTAPSTGQASIDLNAAGVALVQSWIDQPTGNYGIIFQDYTSADNALDMSSRETATAANRPKLTLIYRTSSNRPPVATADAYGLSEDTSLSVAAPGVLGNDSDPDGDALTAVLVSGPTRGTLTLSADGSFIYAPDANAFGSDSFTYKANDGLADSAPVTVTLTIGAVNDPPVGADDAVSTNEDTPAVIPVLANDSDVDGNPLSVTSVSDPPSGSVATNPDGTVTYTPDAQFSGSDSFTYELSDGQGGTSSATVTVTVLSVNDAPSFLKGLDQAVADDAGPQSVAGWASAISAGPADESAQAVSFTASSDKPALFAVQPAVAPDGTLTYTPNTGSAGSALVSVTAHDTGGTANGGSDTSAPQTFTITVNSSGASVTRSFRDGVFPTTGYAGTHDARIRASGPNTAYGSSTTVGANGAADEAALVRWDVSAIPAGSQVVSATLTVNVTNATVDSYEIYELKRDWTEKTVTWNSAATGVLWEVAGVQGASDRGSTVLGVLTAPALGLVTLELNPAGVALVQAWVDNPLANFGIIFQDYASASDLLYFNSKEATPADVHPMLSVTFQAASAPAIMAAASLSARTPVDQAADVTRDVSNTRSEAGELRPDAGGRLAVTSAIDGLLDRDWFHFTATRTGLAAIDATTPASDLDVAVMVRDNAARLARNNNFNGSPDSHVELDVVAGRDYWIKVRGRGHDEAMSSGSYALSVDYLLSTVPHDDYAELGSALPQITLGDQENRWVGQVESAGDHDAFLLAVSSAGRRTIRVSAATNDFEPVVGLYDASGQSIGRAVGAPGGEAVLAVDLVAGDIYYLEVTGNAGRRGGYAVTIGAG